MSAAPKFTPAPWHVRTGDEAKTVYAVTPADEELPICTAHHQYVEDAEYDANASLIAAAPELYEALEAIERAIHDRNYFAIESAFDAGGFARAALAKARGDR